MLNSFKAFLPDWTQNYFKRLVARRRLNAARNYPVSDFLPQSSAAKIRVLFYDKRGLGFAGTQKFLQILAKHLNKDRFEVFFMYGSKFGSERLSYLKDSAVNLIDFSFTRESNTLPYMLEGMRPHIFDVLKNNQIDVLVATGSGYPEFPVANITKLPIVYINVFSSINPQENIAHYICISPYLKRLVDPCLPNRKVDVIYIQSERPPKEGLEWGKQLRSSLGISDDDFLFGRIGRPDEKIFDPIGLLAFEKVVAEKHSAHYLIMAPSQNAIDLVKNRSIPNVHFLPPSGEEKDIWAFHFAQDAMAHFRKDGETQGLNISESMLAGKPIISHKSRVWNAHVEYLDDSFARVAGVDAVDEYAGYMKLFIKLKSEGKLRLMGEQAQVRAESLFLIENNIGKFEVMLKAAVSSRY